MAVELKVPEMGESITEVQIGDWLKSLGEFVRRDEPLVEIESDKATVELPAPVSGTITEVLKQTGETAAVGDVIGHMEESEAPAKKPDAEASAQEPAQQEAPTATPVTQDPSNSPPAHVMPAAQRILTEKGIRPEDVRATGKGGRLLKEDVLRHIEGEQPVPAPAAPRQRQEPPSKRESRTVRMTPMRRRIGERLVEAQQTAALLTTFNEIDMGGVKALREELKEEFQARYGTKLGFMSFFVRACVAALREFPAVNAEIHGEDIIHHDYYDIGIAVSSGKGLVVPVVRDADRMTLAEIERTIADFGARAKENKVKLEELEGGTFSITNGGVFGSLLSTPIVNPPQSAILGMHAIQDRPVARDGQVVIRPMMYVALTYDHRIIDGREAVTFLRTIKGHIEKPAHLLLEG
jgi:2-oxoglutarate dehydrogenase E2 component (dihydrolipoamide succinyltransferase)